MTIAFCVSLLAACGDSTVGPPFAGCDDPPTSCFDPLFESDVLRTKLEGCAGDPVLGGCHGAPPRPTSLMLDLTDPATTIEAALSPLVGQVSSSGDPYIDVECVGDSNLLRKLSSDPGLGSRMPLTSSDWWSNDEVECLRAYLIRTFMQAEVE